MSINWFPGHMHKATKEIRKVISGMDVILEVLDARIPWSSENPVITGLKTDKPRIRLLNKADLADPAITQQWMAQLSGDGVSCVEISCQQQPGKVRELIARCRKLGEHKLARKRNVHVLVLGIPNVGKSTVINTLAGRMVAKSGNEPAVTKAQQVIKLDDQVRLCDTPGILWPRIDNPQSGYRLAVTGAIRNTAISLDDVAFYAAGFLLQAYPDLLKARYGFDTLPDAELDFLEQLGKKRGCLGGGGHVDFVRVGEIFLNDIRSGALGRISFETPAMVEKEEQEVAAELARKAEEKKQKDEARKQNFKKQKNNQ